MAERDLENGERTAAVTANTNGQHQNAATDTTEKNASRWDFLREYKFEKPGHPHLRAIGGYGIVFICIQVSFRFVSAMLSLGAVAFIGYLYNYWRWDATARVDVLFPSFFPLLVGFILDLFEVFSLLWLKSRRKAIHPVAIGFDVALIGTGIFCFLIINMVDSDPGRVFERPDSKHGMWALDMRNAMIFMIVFSLLHAAFILVAAVGVVHVWVTGERSRKNKRLARIQAEMVKFTERSRQAQTVPVAQVPGSIIQEPQRTMFR